MNECFGLTTLQHHSVQTLDINATNGRFDLLNTGNAVRSGWISKEDAFLAIDSNGNGNGNGKIDDSSELFGGEVGEGFAKLAGFDSNGDGQVDKNDQGFAELRLWQDRDSDHQTDVGELISFTEAHITSLSVSYTIRAEHQNGNWVLERSTATTTDGRSLDMADAYFQVEANQAQPPQANTRTYPGTGAAASNSGINNNVTAKATASITVQSFLPQVKPFTQTYPGTVAQPFAQRATLNPILLGKSFMSKWFDGIGESFASANSNDRDGQDTVPVIDWNRDNRKEGKHAGLNSSTNSGKHRNSKWMADFVNGRDDKADRTKLDALKITLPATVLTKGK